MPLGTQFYNFQTLCSLEARSMRRVQHVRRQVSIVFMLLRTWEYIVIAVIIS